MPWYSRKQTNKKNTLTALSINARQKTLIRFSPGNKKEKMNNRNTLLFVIAALIVLTAAFAPASINPVYRFPAYGSIEMDEFQEIDNRIQEKIDDLNIPGASLMIVEGDKIVHSHGFCNSGTDGVIPTPQTPFFIGSMTKSFTAMAVMQLAEEGRIELDAPVQQYLPWFTLADPQASSSITIRDLLNQTSGISQLPGMIGLANFDTSPNSTEQQARALSTLETTHSGEKQFEYSNVNFNLLGLVIENASGKTYAQYIQENIYAPLEMWNSYTDKSSARQNGLVTGHMMWFGFPVAVPDLSVPEGSLASGQLIASAEDIGHYIIAQINGGVYNGRNVVSAKSVSEMHQPAADISVSGLGVGHYGMGWFVREIENDTLIFHHGEVPDYFSYMALLPGHDRGFVLLFNTNQQMYNYAMWDLGETVARQLTGETPQPDNWWTLPWLLRALLLLPVIQITVILTFIKKINHWKVNPSIRPTKTKLWIIYICLPALLDLFYIAAAGVILFSGMFGFIMLFMGDISSILFVCGGISLVWLIGRIWLVGGLSARGVA